MLRRGLTGVHPPSTGLRPGCAEALLLAFGPPEALGAWELRASPADVVGAARPLGLAPRIAARVDEARLRAALGSEAAAHLHEERRRALVRGVQYEELASEIAAVAHGFGTHVLALKGAALHLGGHALPGSRSFGDLDLLAERRHVTPLHDHLRSLGYEAAPGAANEQHLPVLRAPSWGVVDLHWRLRGLSDGRRGWWTTETLAADECTALLPGLLLPNPRLLAAHALAHALDQHVFAAGHHSLTRVLADLTDLLPEEDDWTALESTLGAALDRSVPVGPRSLVRGLLSELRRGSVPDDDAPQGRLLAHLVSHDLDAAYRAGLRWRYHGRRVTNALRRGEILSYIRRKLG